MENLSGTLIKAVVRVRTGSGSDWVTTLRTEDLGLPIDRDAKFKSAIRIPQSQIGRPSRYRSRF